MAAQVEAQFPAKLQPLFVPKRYKVLHGGRGGAKSWGVSRALLILASSRPLRILCTREVQKSIKDSVHKLLSDQIQALGFGALFDVQRDVIKSQSGSEFLFSGLSDMTAESIKSFEGVDIVWCEEAQAISEKSWKILIPTIRKPESEIWISFNPELDTDPTYVRFVLNPPPDSVIIEVNHGDNPWFPEVLEKERLRDKALLASDEYETIWEGKCRSAVLGAIYAKELDVAIRGGRICNVPYDPRLKVHTVWDLGFNDSMVILLVQRLRSEVRVIDYIEESQRTLDWYAAELNGRRMNWGFDWLPHDGANRDFKTGKSAAEILKSFGRKPKLVPDVGVETGIRGARMLFGQVYFDKAKTARLIECLKRYRRSINRNTNEPGAPVHDEFSHGADGYRYLSVVADKLNNESDNQPAPNARQWQPLDATMGY